MTFGRTLQELTRLCGVKRCNLADALGYDPSYISRWINGVKHPSLRSNDALPAQIAAYLTANAAPDVRKLEDGYAMEVLLRRYDDPQKLQIKPFASSEGGGVSICFWADDSNQIVMETGTKNATGGNVWKTSKSGVTPLKDVYYHIVAVWDKAAGTQKIYVDGELKAIIKACHFFNRSFSILN